MPKTIDVIYKTCNLKAKGYSIVTLDLEKVIYKDYGNFDIEVSGLDNYRKKIKGSIFIWHKTPVLTMVKKLYFYNIEDLCKILDLIDNSTLEKLLYMKGTGAK